VATYHLAQFNVGRIRSPLDDAGMAEFVAALDPVNALAEATPGFVWRLQDDDGASSSYVSVTGIDDPLLIVNYSVWADLDSLNHFVLRSGHHAYLRRRREWFEPATEATNVCWWFPAPGIPPVDEAYHRLLRLRTDGPSDAGWPLNRPRPAPGDGAVPYSGSGPGNQE
jgi:hypothetical protein